MDKGKASDINIKAGIIKCHEDYVMNKHNLRILKQMQNISFPMLNH